MVPTYRAATGGLAGRAISRRAGEHHESTVGERHETVHVILRGNEMALPCDSGRTESGLGRRGALGTSVAQDAE